MASSYGEDASSGALRSAYETVSVTTRLSPAYRARLVSDIASHLRDSRAYREAPLVLGYVAMREEFDCTPLLKRAQADGKDVALPTFDAAGAITFCVVTRVDDVVRAGAATPVPNPATSRPIPAGLGLAGSICLVPGLVFDASGYRVAYGAGYWDSYLRGYGGTKVGVAFGMQLSSNPLPHEACDVPVDLLVTESAVWVCRRS